MSEKNKSGHRVIKVTAEHLEKYAKATHLVDTATGKKMAISDIAVVTADADKRHTAQLEIAIHQALHNTNQNLALADKAGNLLTPLKISTAAATDIINKEKDALLAKQKELEERERQLNEREAALKGSDAVTENESDEDQEDEGEENGAAVDLSTVAAEDEAETGKSTAKKTSAKKVAAKKPAAKKK